MSMPLGVNSYLIGGETFRTDAIPLANLRAPTFLPAALFETHVLLWIIVVAIGIGAGLYGYLRLRRQWLVGGGSVLLLALLWIGAAILLDTPAERLRNAHAAMAAAAQKGDIDTLLQYVAPEFRIQGVTLHTKAGGSEREMLAAELRESNIREVHMMHYESALSGPDGAKTTVTVLLTSDTLPPLTTWRVTWQDVPGGDWRITEATLTRLGNEDVPPTGVSAM